MLIGLIGSAWATEWMHVHFIFGAFVFGTVMPREGRAGREANEEASATRGAQRLNHEILERLEQLAVLLLLPMFFVVAGLNVNLRELDLSSLGTLAAILAVAIGGKMLGSYAAARTQRLPNRQSWALATLLNTRGLTEIVILTVGLQKGVLDDELYSLMVVMALVTTAMTGPLLRKVYPDRRVARDIAEAERAALGVTAAHRVLAVVPEPLAEQTPLTDLAATLAGVRSPSEVVLAHLRPYPRGRLEVGTGLSSELTELAETLHDLETLAGAVRARGPEAKVVSRFSADVATELPELVSGAEPDLVVLPADVPGYAEIRAGAVCRVVTVTALVPAETGPESAAGPVAVHHGSGGDAAAHVALMLALSQDRPLIVTGGGRASALARRLAKLGVAATSGAGPGRRPGRGPRHRRRPWRRAPAGPRRAGRRPGRLDRGGLRAARPGAPGGRHGMSRTARKGRRFPTGCGATRSAWCGRPRSARSCRAGSRPARSAGCRRSWGHRAAGSGCR